MWRSEKAGKVVRYTLLASIVIAVILLLTPDPFSRLIGLGLEFAAAAFFPKIQDEEYKEWQTANYSVEPSSGWRSIGWAFLGSLLFFLVIIIVGVIFSLLRIPIP